MSEDFSRSLECQEDSGNPIHHGTSLATEADIDGSPLFPDHHGQVESGSSLVSHLPGSPNFSCVELYFKEVQVRNLGQMVKEPSICPESESMAKDFSDQVGQQGQFEAPFQWLLMNWLR